MQKEELCPVVVIGGGMTAVDAAVQSKLLGADQVTMVYRRGKEKMRASLHEQEHATSSGVKIIYGATPVRMLGKTHVEAVEFAHASGETFELPADQVFKAIGQTFEDTIDGGIALKDGRIAVDATGRTSNARVWAGGDCVHGGDDLTVSAVAMGRDAADAGWQAR